MKGSKLWAAGTATLALAVFLAALSTGYEGYSAAIRAAALYISAAFGLIFSVFPFAASEILLALALPAAVAVFVFQMKKYGGSSGARRALQRVFCALSVLALIFTLNLGVHYSAPPLADQLGLYVGRYSTEQLEQLAGYLRERAGYLAGQVPRAANDECDFGDFNSMSQAAMAAYRELPAGGLNYSALKSPRLSPPKAATLLSVAMSYLGIAGYYFPWTAEAIVSTDTPDFELPFTIAHEAAHSHGIAAEDEANFAAFLALANSPDPRMSYSAYLNAYIYVSNALYSADYQLWLNDAQQRDELMVYDLALLAEHVAKYQTPVREAGEAVNNAYIVATGQPDGVKTYGMVVDLLLAWHFADEVSNFSK